MADAAEVVPEPVAAFPTEQEMLESGLAVAPEDAAVAETVGLLTSPPVVPVIQERDRIQARKILPSPVDGEPDDVAILEFTVRRINEAGEYVGSPIGRIDPAEWDVELLARAQLELPRRKATIEAVLVDGSTVLLTGKQDDWRDENFDPVDPASIRAFQEVPA